MGNSLPSKPYWKELLRPGQRIFIGSGAGCPVALIRRMLPFAKDAGDIEILQGLTLGESCWTEGVYREAIKVNAFYLDPRMSELVNSGVDDYTPAHYSEIPGLFQDGIIPLDVVMVSVSPPDQYGYCSLGPTVEWIPSAMQSAKKVIAQVNQYIPKTYGATQVALSRFDAVEWLDEPLPELRSEALGEPYQIIGQYIAQLINDGDTLQFGVGPVGQSVAPFLKSHRNLGVHSELMGDGMMKLFQEGVITNALKSYLPGKMVVAQALGSQELYSFINDNPHLDFRPSEFVSNPMFIAKNNRMISINSALMVDLTGQVVLDSIRGLFRSGVGSTVDFVRGASMSDGGRPIIALPSVGVDDHGKAYSTITASLPPGAGVGCHRSDVHYIVTEYGIATLRGRTIQERVKELIHIAHPDFREDLLREARAHHLVPPYFQFSTPEEMRTPGVQSRKLKLKDGKDYWLRPLSPSDDRRLQEFFYSHTEETILRRYGFTVTRMSRERAFELVGINQNHDLALAILEMRGPKQFICAVGRYYLDRDTHSAEVAFVVGESKRRLGMARVLMDRMIEVAKERKLSFLWAQVDRSNAPMLSLFRKYNATETLGEDYHSLMVRIDLDSTDTKESSFLKIKHNKANS